VTFGEQLVDELGTGEVGAHSRTELLTGEQDESRWRVQEHEHGALDEPGPIPNLGRHDDPASVSHNYLVCRTHAHSVPVTA